MRANTVKNYSSILLPQTSLILYALGSLTFGLAFFPGVWFLASLWKGLGSFPFAVRLLIVCFALPVSFLMYGFFMTALVGLARKVFRLTLEEGEFCSGAPQAQRWFLLNGLHYICAKTFLDFLRLSPWLNVYLRWMGARIGAGCQINTRNLADMPLLEIGEGVMIGGDAVVICHSVEDGKLKLRRTRIGDRATIGLEAVILGGVTIEEDATLASRAFVLSGSRVPKGAVWAGSPARAVRAPARSEVVGAPLPDGGTAGSDGSNRVNQNAGDEDRSDRVAQRERNRDSSDRVGDHEAQF